MKISRYIKFPLLFGLLMLIPTIFFNSEATVNQWLLSFIYGAIVGIALQIYSDYKTREIKPKSDEKDFSVHHKKQTFLLCDYETAFDLCLESVEFVKKGKVKSFNRERGFIQAKTGMSLNSWGNSIEFQLKKITENATEVEISVQPTLKTVMLNNGEGLEAIETIVIFFESKNEQLNYQLLEAKPEIPIDFYSQNLQSKTSIKN